eukprot:4456457-Pyramimonas_sp.AAC.1
MALPAASVVPQATSLEQKFDALLGRMDGMCNDVAHVASLVGKFDQLKSTVDQHAALFSTIQADLAALHAKFESAAGGGSSGSS